MLVHFFPVAGLLHPFTLLSSVTNFLLLRVLSGDRETEAFQTEYELDLIKYA